MSYSVKLDQELSLEASAGVVLALAALTQQTVHFIWTQTQTPSPL